MGLVMSNISQNHAYITLSVEFDKIHRLLTDETINWTGRDADRQVWMRKFVETNKALSILVKQLNEGK